MNLVSKIESLYSKCTPNSKCKVMYDPSQIPIQRFTAKVSRFKMGYGSCLYDPYKLTPQVLAQLINSINICGESSAKLGIEEIGKDIFQVPIFVRNTSESTTLLEPSIINNCFIDSSLTQVGLLAFRLKRDCNKQFKRYVEENYLDVYYNKVDDIYLLKAEYLSDFGFDYFKLLNLYESIQILDVTTFDMLNLRLPYIWKWRTPTDTKESK